MTRLVSADRSSGPRRRTSIAVSLAIAALIALAVPAATVTATPAGGDDVGTVAPGETKAGSVDDLDPVRDNPYNNGHEGEWYYDPVTVEGEAGDVVSLAAYGDADMSLVLVGPNGSRVAANEDGGPGQNADIVTRLPENGTYTLQVMSHYPEAEFDYVLEMTDYTDEYREDPRAMGVGESRVGYVDYRDARNMRFGGYYDAIPLNDAGGENVTVAMSTWVDSAVYLVDADGNVVEKAVAPASGSDVELTTTVPNSGQYSLVVGSGDDDPHFAYRVSVAETAAEDGEERNHADSGDDESAASPGHHGHESTVHLGPDPQVVELTTNRTNVTPGEPVELRATVANLGDEATAVEHEIGNETAEATVDAYSMEYLTATRTFDGIGPRTVVVANETATVHVTAPDDAHNAVDTDDGVVGYAPDADDGDRVSFAADESEFGLTALNATAVGEAAAWFQAEALTDRPDNVSAPSADAVGYVALGDGNGDAPDGLSNASVSVRVPDEEIPEAGAVALYGYDADAESWEQAPTTRTASDESGATYRAAVGNASLVAAAAVDDPVERRASIDRDAPALTVALENRGSVAVDRTVTVAVDGERVAQENLTVPASETASTTVALDDLAPGTHEVSVGGDVVGTLQVDGETATPTATAAPDTETDATTTTAGEGDGFGVPAVLAALGALALVAFRR